MSFEEPLGELAAVAPVAQVTETHYILLFTFALSYASVDDHWSPPVAGSCSFEDLSKVGSCLPARVAFFKMFQQMLTQNHCRFCQSKAPLEEKEMEYTSVSTTEELQCK